MPFTDLHKRKRAKNFAVLLAIVAMVVLIFCVTIVRLKMGAAQ